MTQDYVQHHLNEFAQKEFLDELEFIRTNYPEMASRTLVFVPQIENLPYYGVFDFSSTTAANAYTSVSDWANMEVNEPMTLDAYLAEYGR